MTQDRRSDEGVAQSAYERVIARELAGETAQEKDQEADPKPMGPLDHISDGTDQDPVTDQDLLSDVYRQHSHQQSMEGG
ncbi:hypothetical protein CWE17_06640 [Synechococcus sp. BS56D]|jgi:hypothetical protein|uniref:hypothetical protein n=1 Tax=Synechococcus sp. BS56D TaxID=2055944 RepID=UPI0010389926|nr:hypothetical protein [Synechococcus sp. BS56D]TCD58735.1 hypothetical protein CWE17_06640 [Synechococcus sp. BS56D]